MNFDAIPVRKIMIAVLLVAIIGLLARWLYMTSYITIGSPPAKGKIAYTLTNQANRQTIKTESDSGDIKLRVPKGNYELLAKQDGSSHFVVVQARGLLKTTALRVELKSEKYRQFVGNNPQPCISYLRKLLVSYNCDSLLADVSIHQPATADLPTIVTKAAGNVSDYIEGFADTTSGSIGLFRSFFGQAEGDGLSYYSLNRFDGQFKVRESRDLKDLDLKKRYSLLAYDKVFIVYDARLGEVYNFTSWHEPPKKLDIDSANQSDVSPVSLIAQGRALTKFYSGAGPTEKSEVVYWIGGKSVHWILPKAYNQALVCGERRVCALANNKQLDVYDTSGNSPRYLYRLVDVQAVAASADNFYVVNGSGVMDFDAVNQSGYLQYSFGDYRFRGIQPVGRGYVLSLDAGQSGQTALYINPAITDSHQIDKKVMALRNNPLISTVSAYGKYIFISPNMGQPTYLKELDGYGFDPQLRSAANNAAELAARSIGISRPDYQLITY